MHMIIPQFRPLPVRQRNWNSQSKIADGKQIGTLTADVPEGAFHAASSGADIQMEVTANTQEADVLEQVQKLTEDTVGTSVVTDVTFYVDGQKQAPQQTITLPGDRNRSECGKNRQHSQRMERIHRN